MSNEKIDLKQFEGIESAEQLLEQRAEDIALIAFQGIAELKRCYEELDVLQELLRTGLMDEEIYNQVKASM